MRRLLCVAVLVLTASACTPEELAWWHARVAQAEADGQSCPQWAPLLETFGLPSTFGGVMERESNCRPEAYNRSGASGLLQVMPIWADDCGLERGELFDPVRNVACAAVIYERQGPSAWSQTWP